MRGWRNPRGGKYGRNLITEGKLGLEKSTTGRPSGFLWNLILFGVGIQDLKKLPLTLYCLLPNSDLEPPAKASPAPPDPSARG